MIASFVLAGQSNIDQWFHAGDGAALAAFEETFLALNPQYTSVAFFDASRGGSAMLRHSAERYAAVRAGDDPALFERISTNHWYDETTGTGGPTLDLFTSRLEAEVASGTEFLGIIWAQGEADTAWVDETNAGTYEEGLAYVLDQLMEASGAPEVYIQALGDRSFYSEDLHGGTDAIRDAQEAVADGSDAITLATTIFDLDLRDSTHLTVEAYEIAARRMAEAISTGETSPGVGEAFLMDDRTILVQLDLVPGQTADGGFGLGGFALFENGVEVEITGVTITPGGLLRIETASPVSAPVLSYAAPRESVTMLEGDYIRVTGEAGSVPILPFEMVVANPTLEIAELAGGLLITGTSARETITGLSGDDVISGLAGHDTIDGGWGSDTLTGGDGSDVFVMGADGAADTVLDFDTARDAIGLAGATKEGVVFRDSAAGLEVETADGGVMVLSGLGLEDAASVRFHTLGSEGDNTLTGHDGEDRIFAGGGDDVIDTGAGTDRITTGDGADSVVFGTGYGLNVVYDFDLSEDRIVLSDLQATSLTFLDYKGTDLELRTDSGDRLVLRDVSLADAGLVQIVDAPPTVGVLTGTEGRDVLRGTGLDELFIGLGGTDRLYGGGGADVFSFHEGAGLDVVYDFEDGLDRILIEGGSFESLTLLTYKGTDAEIRLATGDRLVLRDVDIADITADDFVFEMPDMFV